MRELKRPCLTFLAKDFWARALKPGLLIFGLVFGNFPFLQNSSAQTLSTAGYVSVGKNERENVIKTLVAGLQNKRQTIESKAISGIGIEKRFISESGWRFFDSAGVRHQGQYADRDMALVRFNLSNRKWIYEVQQLLWAGGSNWFSQDFKRKPTQVQDLYKRSVCDGEKIYHFTLWNSPKGFVETLPEPLPGLNLDLFRTGFGLSLGSLAFDEFLSISRESNSTRVFDVMKGKLKDRDTYLVIFGKMNNVTITESRVWIDPAVGFSVVRVENFGIYKSDPTKGSRYVGQWSDLVSDKNAGGAFLPQNYNEQYFVYHPSLSKENTWRTWREINFQELTIQNEFVFDPMTYMLPVGTMLNGFNELQMFPQSTISEEVKTNLKKSYSPWDEAQNFSNSPLPRFESEFTQPLKGTELKALADKYGFALP